MSMKYKLYQPYQPIQLEPMFRLTRT